ncbi:uroporphyrinogen-III synthase [Pararhizobium sp.]|uniref:uroporphyrinogen-III synthase n=1 Tax=Pararhizobium sp. TaxID=1977563 RepID=UPI0027187663|nr:uroporphyrinogen-III synthase [Pararhizobium sp.]MDO9416537.1 uroporphyrinogen-III synthase [Pararhizobium sp.]
MARVLVTRPQPAAARTAAKLASLGHQPIVLPLAEALHDLSAARDGLAQNPKAIALTSAEAIRVLAKLGTGLQPFLATPLFAVGTATAEAARSLGFKTVLTGPGTGEGLARLVLKKTPAPLLYLAGTPRSSGFEEALILVGRQITIRECYKMIDIDHPPGTLETIFAGSPPYAVLLYSPETARRFFSLDVLKESPQKLESTRLLCISDAVARVVPSAFDSAISVSLNPDEASLLGLL